MKGIENRRLLLFFCLSLGLSGTALFEYVKNAGTVIIQLSRWHAAHLINAAPAPLQFRAVNYMLAEFLQRITSMPIEYVYLFMRFAFFAGALFVGMVTIEKYRNRNDENAFPSYAVLFAFCFTLFYAASSFAHIMPSEEINIFFFFCLIYLYLNNVSWMYMAPLFVLSIVNKETTLFFPIFMILERGFRLIQNKKPIATIINPMTYALPIVLFVVGILVQAIIRLSFGIKRPYLGLSETLWPVHNWRFILGSEYNFQFFQIALDARLHLFVIAFFIILPIIFFAVNFRRLSSASLAFVVMSALFFVGHFLISHIEEFRTFSPLMLGYAICFIDYNRGVRISSKKG